MGKKQYIQRDPINRFSWNVDIFEYMYMRKRRFFNVNTKKVLLVELLILGKLWAKNYFFSDHKKRNFMAKETGFSK